MSERRSKPRWSFPLACPQPADETKRRWTRLARIVAYVALAGALITPVVQFQTQTLRNLRKAAKFDRKHPNRTRADAAAGPKRPRPHKGAIGRWRKAIHAFWAGRDIYCKLEDVPEDAAPGSRVWLHPNMPFVVILLTPLAYLPVPAMALTWNILKLISLVATFAMLARVAAHKDRPIADWVFALALAWSVVLISGDIQHGNTNVFVLCAVVGHLWLYRRGRDGAAGAALALAICLKMTPAIFLLYWLYQRNWKLLTWAVAALVVLAVIVPAATIGTGHYAALSKSWLDNLIFPGLLAGAWYPIHINQSIPGVFSRYFLDGPNGNIFWNPDDNPYELQKKFRWITLTPMSPATVRMLIRLSQLAVVALAAWAIGRRKLPRDDGRRSLHYGLVVIVMLLCNQRTWDHHAGMLLIATVAIWQAIAFGRFTRKVRPAALLLTISGGLVLLVSKSGVLEAIGRLVGRTADEAEDFADVGIAYGPLFYHFLLLLAAAALLAVAIRKSDPPYAENRQKLFD